MKKIYVKIDGIHCNHCETKITKALIRNKKIKEIKIIKDIAHISYDGKLDYNWIIKTITDLDYITKEEYISENLKDVNTNIKLKEFVIIFISIVLISILLNNLLGFNIFNMIPTIDSSITYGMLIVTGLFTSIHCISMCGAINLLAVLNNDNKKRNITRPILYNTGRVISYTLIGAVAGLIGSVININYTVMGIIIIIASIIMFLMSLNMLGISKFKFPFIHTRIKKKTSNSFIIGLLNGIMPCGPLQAMQIYALSTGNPLTGALSMFLFGIGTVPLMFFIGIVINLVKGKRKILINKIASILILILSLVMLNRGLLTLNIDIFKSFNNNDNYTKSILKDGYQEIEFDLNYDNYEDIIIQKDIPVKLIIHVDERYLTGCNNELVLKEFGIKKELKVGDNVIEFTPSKTGIYTYTCWMNMIKNNIKVIDDINYFEEDKDE